MGDVAMHAGVTMNKPCAVWTILGTANVVPAVASMVPPITAIQPEMTSTAVFSRMRGAVDRPAGTTP